MNYIGNQSSWITNDLMEILEASDGDNVPIWDPNRWQRHPLMDNVREMGTAYFKDSIPQQFFHVFKSGTKGLENYNFKLPKFPETRKNLIWWFVKLKPGELQLMHYDMHVLGVQYTNNNFSEVLKKNPVTDSVRYTMFLQDWEPGHVFVYNDKINPKYKKGDIYEWSDPELYHGVVNLSFNIRYTLQITMYD
jgi:hypothetical protein